MQVCKDQLADAALLAYISPQATLSLCTDASDTAVGAVAHQPTVDGHLQLLGFFLKKTKCGVEKLCHLRS